MSPQFTVSVAHSSSTSSSSTSSSLADRRLSALVRHLGVEDSTSAMSNISANPTSAFNGDSVFAHVAQAPEDPILGVILFYLSIYLFIYLSQFVFHFMHEYSYVIL